MAIPNANIRVEVPKWKYDDEDEGYECDDATFTFGLLYMLVPSAAPGVKPHATLCGAGLQGWVATNNGVQGELVVLRLKGQVGVTAGAAFNAGIPVMSNAVGQAIAHVAAAGNYVVGVSGAAASQPGHRVNMEVHSYVA